MKKTRYSEEQIAFALRQAETGTPVGEVIRKMGISTQTFYRWKKQFGQMGVDEIRRLKQLDARWELDVLKSRMGMETNYDSLVRD